MSCNFFAYLYRMRYIRRWGLMKNGSEENLAEHSLDAAVIAHALAVIRRDILKKEGPAPSECALAALYHDAPEILTGDLPTPVKYFNPEIREAYKKVEKNATGKLISMLPPEMQGEYRRLLAETQGECAQTVHWADKLSAYIKCREELKSGNTEFRTAEKQIGALLAQCEIAEVQYFCKNFLPAYGLTLDELE